MENLLVVGFTGTREAISAKQHEALSDVVGELMMCQFHHGACTGADEAAAIIAKERGDVRIVAHPGRSASGVINDNVSQAALEVSDEMLPVQTHFARNRDIVDGCDVLLACPRTMEIGDSGGTAYTIGYAKRRGKMVIVCWPDGTVTKMAASDKHAVNL